MVTIWPPTGWPAALPRMGLSRELGDPIGQCPEMIGHGTGLRRIEVPHGPSVTLKVPLPSPSTWTLGQTLNVTFPEIPLAGGNASSFVARVGDTVRKPWTSSTATVQRLLVHLRAEIGDLVPEPRGRDDQGRQTLEFVPGVETMSELPITEADAERIGATIRDLHEATASFQRRNTDVWTTAMRRPGDEIIGQCDLAPWNLIRSRDRWAVHRLGRRRAHDPGRRPRLRGARIRAVRPGSRAGRVDPPASGNSRRLRRAAQRPRADPAGHHRAGRGDA